jgi:hypothetical protein
MVPSRSRPRKRNGPRRSERARRRRNGALAVAVILIATGALTVFAGSNVLCTTAATGVGFCPSPTTPNAASGAPSPVPPPGVSPAPPPSPSPRTWTPGPSSLLAPNPGPGAAPSWGDNASPAPSPPPPPKPPADALPLVFIPDGINDTMLGDIASAVEPYMKTGDTVVLTDGADDGATGASASYLNNQLAYLRPQLPKGITYEARTGGLANVKALVRGGLSSHFSSVLYDYEPGFESEFTTNFTSTLANFVLFAGDCHAAGFQAVGYPYGLPLWDLRDQNLNWNYGTLLASSGIDGLQIQDQGSAHVSLNDWNRSIGFLTAQYAAYGIPAADMSLQLTVATGLSNSISVASAYAAYEAAMSRGVGEIMLFWNLSGFSNLMALLHLIRG